MKRYIKSSNIGVSTDWKISARTWPELIRKLKLEAGVDVDSVDRRNYNQFIIGYMNGEEYEIEVTRYSDGYEVMFDNINPVNPVNASDVIDEYEGLSRKAKTELRDVMRSAMDQVFDQKPDADFTFCLDNVIGLTQGTILHNASRYNEETVSHVKTNSKAFRRLVSEYVESMYDEYRDEYQINY